MKPTEIKTKWTLDEVFASGNLIKNKHKLIFVKKDRRITVYKLINNYYVKDYSYLS